MRKRAKSPCTASGVRRKLGNLLQSKDTVPGKDGKKKWSNTSLAEELEKLESQMGAVQDVARQGARLNALQVGKFMKKTGTMRGGDSPVYYWGYVLCEKLRIWNGEKKTKSRKETEEK